MYNCFGSDGSLTFRRIGTDNVDYAIQSLIFSSNLGIAFCVSSQRVPMMIRYFKNVKKNNMKQSKEYRSCASRLRPDGRRFVELCNSGDYSLCVTSHFYYKDCLVVEINKGKDEDEKVKKGYVCER